MDPQSNMSPGVSQGDRHQPLTHRPMRRVNRVHMIGIGGVGMAGIARVLLNLGYQVTGSDIKAGAATRALADQGAEIFVGHAAENIERADVVVVSTAVAADNPEVVAQTMTTGLIQVRKYRKTHKDAFYYNWLLQIQPEFQQPFDPTHENMAALHLHRDQPKHLLAANLRRARSGGLGAIASMPRAVHVGSEVCRARTKRLAPPGLRGPRQEPRYPCAFPRPCLIRNRQRSQFLRVS